MKLAISNIAWDSAEDEEVSELLKKYNVLGLEVAPTKIYSEPEKVTQEVLNNYTKYWNQKNMSIIAMQSLLFNKTHLSIFGETSNQTLEYLSSIIDMASKLSARALVFGSPKCRLVGNKNPQAAREEAVDFFRKLGDIAYKRGVYICIEANPIEYGCDFITTTLEGLQFVKDVNHKAIKLQIDTGTIFINREDPLKILEACSPFIGHFHISEPHLSEIGQSDHLMIANVLKDLKYDGWTSIEMKKGLNQKSVISVSNALDYVTQIYY